MPTKSPPRTPTIPTTFPATAELRDAIERERIRRGLRSTAETIRALLMEAMA